MMGKVEKSALLRMQFFCLSMSMSVHATKFGIVQRQFNLMANYLLEEALFSYEVGEGKTTADFSVYCLPTMGIFSQLLQLNKEETFGGQELLGNS